MALDVNEILPEVDPAGITAITGAKIIREAVISGYSRLRASHSRQAP